MLFTAIHPNRVYPVRLGPLRGYGILGREIVFEPGRNSQKWPTVHALSRSKKEDYPSNVIHNYIDLTRPPKIWLKT